MSPELRRGLAALLAGTAASLAALMIATWMRARSCTGAGGRWVEAARRCELPAGVTAAPVWQSSLVGAVIGFATLLVLWRTYTYFADRRPRAPR
jgi:hypothetical protein